MVTALAVWQLRWIWPLQLLPGWVVALLFAWAGVEVMPLSGSQGVGDERKGRIGTCPPLQDMA